MKPPPEERASIEDARRGIDALDREVVAPIGDRARYVEAAAQFKTNESGAQAPERRHTLLEARRRWAEEEWLSPDVVEAVYETLISYFVDQEINRWRNTPSY
ncbi:MAG: chorismate mutase [Actinomycetota bacterium]|nr:chorismate mutase [Actinomycetota bacterium]